MSQPLTVGIHGLNNKPRPDTLTCWWMAALTEGLRRNLKSGPGLPEFQLVYWADLNHPMPRPAVDDPEPYEQAEGDGPMRPARLGRRRTLSALGLEAAGRALETIAASHFLKERIDHLIEDKVNDLFRYQTDPSLRHAVRLRLSKRLQKAAHDRRPVLLIAHSMGSIIAYDVLRAAPTLSIRHFVTIGSPLGLSEVKQFSSVEFGAPRIPDGVAAWTNLADPRDKVAALDLRLASDYEPGKRCSRIIDLPASNTYVTPDGAPNPHKVYGYLRTPEISTLIANWLSGLER